VLEDVQRNVLLAGLVLAAAAISVWTLAPALQGREAARRDIGTHRLAFGAVVTMLTLNLLITLPLAEFLRGSSLTITTFAIAALATQIPMLLVVYVRLILPKAVTWQELGLRPLPIDRIFRVGLTIGLLGLMLTILVQLVLTQLGLRPNQMEQFGFVRGADLLGFALILLLAAGTAPFSEEVFFRGFLFGLYRLRQPLWLAYLVSGVLFAAAHLVPMRMNLAQMAGLAIGIFMLGTLLAWTYQRTRSLYPSMVAHALNNATGLVLLYSVTPQ
jgi:uncharacterized protein